MVSSLIIADGYAYEVIENVREGFQEDAFIARYSDILTKYDYIVGDWGYGQLRLKGFLMTKIKNPRLIQKLARFKTICMNIVILDAPIL